MIIIVLLVVIVPWRRGGIIVCPCLKPANLVLLIYNVNRVIAEEIFAAQAINAARITTSVPVVNTATRVCIIADTNGI